MTALKSLLLRAVRSLSDGSGSFVPRISSRRAHRMPAIII